MHSPEPWRVEDYNSNCGYVFDANGDDIHSGYFDGEMEHANAQRIVACVNFCMGLPDSVLARRDPTAYVTLNSSFVRIPLSEVPTAACPKPKEDQT